MGRHYDMQGQPITRQQWAESLVGDASRVERTAIGDVTVSTVWLGLDHSFDGGPPLIFETMIFGGEHDQYQERYSTLEEARAGHERAVERAQPGGTP
jgi:hypothetical protein